MFQLGENVSRSSVQCTVHSCFICLSAIRRKRPERLSANRERLSSNKAIKMRIMILWKYSPSWQIDIFHYVWAGMSGKCKYKQQFWNMQQFVNGKKSFSLFNSFRSSYERNKCDAISNWRIGRRGLHKKGKLSCGHNIISAFAAFASAFDDETPSGRPISQVRMI